MLAPDLMRAWVHNAMPDAVRVLRLMAAAVAADAIGLGAYNVLLGRGAARTIFFIMGSSAAVGGTVGLVLLYAIGIPGPAVALLIVTAFFSIVMLHIAAHDHSISAWRVLVKASHSLLLPLGVCACACSACVRVGTPQHWGGVAIVACVGVIAYLLGLRIFGGREEERMLLRSVLRFPASILRFGYSQITRRASVFD